MPQQRIGTRCSAFFAAMRQASSALLREEGFASVGQISYRPTMSTQKGAMFCRLVRSAVEQAAGQEFEQEAPLLVGSPPRLHKFDLANLSRSFVGEVKAYVWTGGNNIPSAKIATLKEAIQFLHALPPGTRTFLVMQRDLRPSTSEPLADYFSRLHGHFLGDTTLLELDIPTSRLRVVRGLPLT